ncbi:MAG: glycerol-3-phosphate acyltransferase [candidate division WOR-3 bacterium]|uniref:Glycerol-3-phosphate acyltransferase n=2 Tax=candidate division WOR-3 bacterium TaxID=2052148 RepID=A0A7C3F0X1_UNCW3|nr:glycerol-3-phosphate acyltransferase [candidate division WOR-3 bacterium]
MNWTGLLLVPAAFFSGALMFSWWLARLRGRDLRQIGDGNPGAVNAFRAAGPVIGILGLLLDFLKGMIPAGLGFWHFHISGILLFLLILAPVLGHAFSPFLRLRGGKGLAVTFGVWSGITLYQVPVFLGALLILTKFILRLKRDAWCVALTMLCLPVFVGLRYRSLPLFAAALGNAVLVICQHRRELRR